MLDLPAPCCDRRRFLGLSLGAGLGLALARLEQARADGVAVSDDGLAVARRPMTAADVHATAARLLGLDPAQTRTTPEGRPLRTVDEAGEPLDGLVAA